MRGVPQLFFLARDHEATVLLGAHVESILEGFL